MDVPDLLHGIATTRAIRRYRDEEIPLDALATMRFAATRAPSGSNRQGFRFLVLRDGPKAVAAKAVLGSSFRQSWADKRTGAGFADRSCRNDDTPKARAARSRAPISPCS